MDNQSGYITTKDQFEIFWQSWIPDQKPIASVFIIHGIADHSSRFRHVAGRCNANQIACFAIDLRGHGRSSGTRAYIQTFGDYLIDVQAGWRLMQETLNDDAIPFFLFGHSMGSLIAIHFIHEMTPQLNGLMTSAALVKVNEDLSPILIRLSGILSALLPKLKTVKLDLDQLSSDPEVKEDALQDPLYIKDGLRARTGAEVLRATKQAGHMVGKIQAPVLIMHGKKDELTKIESSELLYQDIGSQDKQLILYPDARHELVNELNKEEIIQTMVNWVKDHC